MQHREGEQIDLIKSETKRGQITVKYISLFLIFIAVSSAQEVGARYLIITHDNFYNDIQPLAEWKHKKGMRTKVVTLSQIGSTSSQIKSYIQNAYNTWQTPPEYLLLVGAPNLLPWGSSYSDNYYMDMDSDIFNEILAGRLTVHSSTEAQTVVNKILLYERTPDLTDSTWFIDACLIVNEDYNIYPPQPGSDDYIYWSDIRHAYTLMLANGYNEMDTLSDLLGDDANDVIQSVNNGRAFVLYRGQGVGNWWSPFGVNPNYTANGNRLPIVLSITCRTIGTGSSPAIAEQWLLTGTPTEPRGGAGYFATTTTGSHIAHLRSATAQGFFTGIFVDGKKTFGEACESGRLNVYTMYGSSSEYRGFATLGDPEMNIWTGIPRLAEVSHDSILYAGTESLSVMVTLNSAAVESALVCIVLDTTIYEYGYTAPDGTIDLYLDTLYSGTMELTVSGQNIIPYETVIEICDTNPIIAYQSHMLTDSLCNNNGIPERGETILLRTLVKNIGVSPAHDVKGILRTNDTLVYITDSVVSFGDLYPQDSSDGLNPFVFTIAPYCPGGHDVYFSILISDTAGGEWNSNFVVNIQKLDNSTGPDVYGYYMYDNTDSLSGNAPVFEWIEIASPTNLVSEITDEYSDTVTYTLPFGFKFYGMDYPSIGICTNGFLEMGRSSSIRAENQPIPAAGEPYRFLAPFWDDLDPSQQGDIYYYYDDANHRWIVEYESCAHYGNHMLQETFQVILMDPQYYPTPTGDGQILFQYMTVADATSNTVGIEHHTEIIGLQYLYNGYYHPNARPIIGNRAILVTTKPPTGFMNTPWLYMTSLAMDDSVGGNNNGIAEPGETIDIHINIHNNGDTIAHAVEGTLSTTDSDVQILDGFAAFGDISAGSTVGNPGDPYSIHISATPTDSTAGLILHLVANNGTYQKTDYFTVIIHDATGIQENGTLSGQHVYGLHVHPSPFRDRINISYGLLSTTFPADRPTLKVFDITGRLVKSFILSNSSSAFTGSVTWDGTDDYSRSIAQGVYFVQMENCDHRYTKKIVFLK